MKAVASVVLNRVYVNGGEYARIGRQNIRNIVFQPGQFNCVAEYLRGRYNYQNIYNMNPGELEYSIADWALSGNRLYPLGSALWFYNPYSPTCRQNFPSRVGYYTTRVNQHCFYNPTSQYYNT